jgi:hypothetical protein
MRRGYYLHRIPSQSVSADLIQPLPHHNLIVVFKQDTAVPGIGFENRSRRVSSWAQCCDEGVGPVGCVRRLLFPNEPGLDLRVFVNIWMGVAVSYGQLIKEEKTGSV